MLRQYEPVWIQIKETGSCEISAHKAYHRRIRKAVWKEKHMDLAYKQECLEADPPVVARMTIKVIGSIIRFKLYIKPLITVDTI